jgi:hypothetical protein
MPFLYHNLKNINLSVTVRIPLQIHTRKIIKHLINAATYFGNYSVITNSFQKITNIFHDFVETTHGDDRTNAGTRSGADRELI